MSDFEQLNTRQHTREQYADESRLARRISVWHPTLDGRDPATEALGAVLAELSRLGHNSRVIEVGCGTGDFAARVCDRVPRPSYLATDQSERMVELTRERGLHAEVAEADRLPVDDESADVLVANWMLYHVPDLDAALAEFRRVLRPGGLLVAITNGDDHLADLFRECGMGPLVTQFSTENGAAALKRHFEKVDQVDLATRAFFADHAAAQAYIDTFSTELTLPHFEGEREYAGATTVFTAR